jgi:hypothetical protein
MHSHSWCTSWSLVCVCHQPQWTAHTLSHTRGDNTTICNKTLSSCLALLHTGSMGAHPAQPCKACGHAITCCDWSRPYKVGRGQGRSPCMKCQAGNPMHCRGPGRAPVCPTATNCCILGSHACSRRSTTAQTRPPRGGCCLQHHTQHNPRDHAAKHCLFTHPVPIKQLTGYRWRSCRLQTSTLGRRRAGGRTWCSSLSL